MEETEAKSAMRWNELPGRQFGPYEILEEVGRGGTSRVYRAFDHDRNREVAFKIIPNDAEDRVAFIQRFIRETEIVRKLNHLNIVPIYDAGETDEFVYQAMKFVQGATLRHRAAQRMSMQEAAQYMVQAANALHHAHLQGIVHRDVKPSNMLLPSDDPALLLLTDFGTAKILGARGPTKTGATIGTPEYMSPEQAEGREVDQRSDIYSLGCTLYEALAGRPPFIGATPVSVLYQQVHAQPTYIRSYNNSVPRELWNVLRICLAKRPEDRYPSAERLAEDLLPFAEGLIQPTPAPWRAPATGRLQFDPQDRPTNRTLRAQPSRPFDGGPQATPQVTPLPAPFTPSAAPITPSQISPQFERGPSSQPGFGPRPPRTTLRLPEEMGMPLSDPAPRGASASGAGRGPLSASGPLGSSPYAPLRAPSSQPGAPPSGPGGAFGSWSAPSGPSRGPNSTPRPGVPSVPRSGINSGPLRAPVSGADWPAAGATPAGYRGPNSGPLRSPVSGPYRSAQSGPVRGTRSGYDARVGVASAPRPGAGRRAAPPTTPLRSRPSKGMLMAGVGAFLLLAGAMALGAAGLGMLPGQGTVARPTATLSPTATPSPTATATTAPPTATATPNAQKILDQQAAAAFRGLTIAPFSDLSCTVSNQTTHYSTSQPVFVNLCTANKSMPGPVTVVIRSNGAVVRTLFYKQYFSSSSSYSQGHTLAPGSYDMLITVTINGKTATAKDIPFTVG
jgi:serine/threonine protein kinase